MSAVKAWRSGGTQRGALVAVALACALLGWFAANARAQSPSMFNVVGITTEETRGNSGIMGGYSLPAEEMPASRTVVVPPDDEEDDVPLRMPDTSGNQPNLAAFQGQTFTLREEDRGNYTRIHFFGMTTDGSGGGDFVLTYAGDGGTQNVTVSFPDWCQNGHRAIGPLSKRWTLTGSDGAPCSIFHHPAEIDESKQLVSIKFPPNTVGGPPDVAHLMALTLEAETPEGPSYRMPDLSGREPCAPETIPPVTTHVFDPPEPDGGDGWYAGAVGISLDATDDGGSGVEQVLYRIDGGPVRPYAGEVAYDVDGEHTLEYRSIDCAGNAEEFKSVDFKVDAHAPTTTARTSPSTAYGPDGWYDGAVSITLEARDGEGSGTAASEYRLDGGGWTPYAGAIAVDQAGSHVVGFRSRDVAGNVETERSLPIRIDATPPVTTALINGAAPQPAYAIAARVAFVRTDGEGSGAVGTEYRVDGGAWTGYTGAFDVRGLGAHRVDYRSRDVVGNTEPYRTVRFTLTVGPLATGAPPDRLAAFAALAPLTRSATTLRAFRRGGLTVRVTCRGVDRGTLALRVSRATAKRLRLGSRVLAARSLRCGEQGRASVRLRPGAKVRKALARSRGNVAGRLTLRMGDATDASSIVLRRG
jgi:hypothetical protein